MSFFSQAFANTASEIEIGNVAGAAGEATPGVASSLMSFFPLIIIFIIFYFLIIRPQQKKAKNHEKMISSIKRGDKISTIGGIIGIVTKVDNNKSIFTIEVAENVNIKIIRSSVAEVMNRSQVKEDNDAER